MTICKLRLLYISSNPRRTTLDIRFWLVRDSKMEVLGVALAGIVALGDEALKPSPCAFPKPLKPSTQALEPLDLVVE